jgi:hypothetical protein
LLDFRLLGEGERIVDVDPEIANRALDLGMTEMDLHRAQVAGLLLDDGRTDSKKH